MKLYLAFYDFYAILIGVFGDKNDAIDAAREKGDDSWVEEWTLGVKDERIVVWRPNNA